MKKPSPAMIIAVMALVFSMTGSSIAASHYLIASQRQIRPMVRTELVAEPERRIGAVIASLKATITGLQETEKAVNDNTKEVSENAKVANENLKSSEAEFTELIKAINALETRVTSIEREP